jgi:hypothetical protein
MSCPPSHAAQRKRAASHYIDTAELARLVQLARAEGRASDALGRALMQIAGGVWDRYHFTPDREDFVSEVTLHLLQRPLDKADVQKHIFNYFTTCAIRFGMKLRDKLYGDRRRFETYAAELVESGRELPERE